MFPLLQLSFLRTEYEFHTQSLIFYLTLIVTFLLFIRFSKLNFLQSLILYSVTCLSTLAGARVFHVYWELGPSERPPLREIFLSYRGMTLYGGIALGFLILSSCCFAFLTSEKRKNVFDLTACLASLSTALLRLGCFVQGCCWGKYCQLPWAVQYTDDRGSMPNFYLPVHPVQVYESALCFLLTFLLLTLYFKNVTRGNLMWYYLAAYSGIRIFTEYFRADSFRGENIFLHFSTSQVISFLILLCAAVKSGVAFRKARITADRLVI